MLRRALLFVFALTYATAAVAQLPPAVDEALKSAVAAGDKAKVALAPVPPPAADYTLTPVNTAEFQNALLKAPEGSTIALRVGTVYGSTIVGSPGTTRKLTVTSQGWVWPDSIAAVMPRKADWAKMAVIKGDDRQGYGLWALSSGLTIKGVVFMAMDPAGQGEMLRLGDATDPVLAHVPHNIAVLQSPFLGSTAGETATGTSLYGQKRAIALNSADTLVDQIWCQDIFIAGQDSQCIAIFSTPGNITVRRSFLSAAAEPMIVGGVPPAGPDFLPNNITVEDNIFYHPLKWKGRTPAAVVKNLFELKIGTNIIVRRNLMVNHWPQAQPGYPVVATLASNGACSYCRMGPVLFENNVVYNVSAGMNITGYQYTYAPGSGQFTQLTVRNNLFVINSAVWGGNGRPVVLSNEMTKATFDHNTFIHTGNAFISADFGSKWPYQTPPLTAAIKGGSMTGIVYTNNLTYYGSYGIFTSAGSNGVNLTQYFPDLVLGGNVLGGAPTSALTLFNAFAGAAGPNVGPTVAMLDAAMVNRAGVDTDPSGACLKAGTPYTGKGADCTALAPVFALRKLLPLEPPQTLTVTRREAAPPRAWLTPGAPLTSSSMETCVEQQEGNPLCFPPVKAAQKK